MDCNVTATAVTLNPSCGLTTLPSVAVRCVVPAATPVANPVFAPIVANAVFDDFQVTLVVMTFVLLSLYVPIALNCCIFPAATVGALGLTAMDCSVGAGFTTSAAVLLVALPYVLLATTSNFAPSSPLTVAGVV